MTSRCRAARCASLSSTSLWRGSSESRWRCRSSCRLCGTRLSAGGPGGTDCAAAAPQRRSLTSSYHGNRLYHPPRPGEQEEEEPEKETDVDLFFMRQTEECARVCACVCVCVCFYLFMFLLVLKLNDARTSQWERRMKEKQKTKRGVTHHTEQLWSSEKHQPVRREEFKSSRHWKIYLILLWKSDFF